MKRLHLICNAHLDPVWQWTWDEGIAAAISTFRSAADLCDEFDYIFCHNEALLYEAVENFAPELFERIKKLVAAGKWKIIGGWYLQPDCNMPCGESFVRQIKAGERYFKEKFGVKPTVACNFDSFGHSVGLVQIMKKCGFNGYIFTRPAPDAFPDYPGAFFEWESPDGSKVIASRLPGYGTGLGRATEKIRNCLDGAEDVDAVLWGVGNHGGGPSRKDLTDIKNFKAEGFEIFHSSPEALFADNIKISGKVKRSFVTSMPGCYTSMMRIKQAHRQTESLIYSTEKMMSIAALAGCGFDYDSLREAEKKMLLAEFHDILPGSGVVDAENEGLELLSAARKAFRDSRTKAFMYLTMGEKAAEQGEYPIFAFNFMPYELTCPVEAEFSLADQNWSEDFVFAPEIYQNGKKLPCQQIKENATLNLDWRKRIIFEAPLKPLSVTRFSVRPVKKDKVKAEKPAADIEKSIKSSGVLAAPVSLLMYEDCADPWAMGDEAEIGLGKNPAEFVPMTKAEAEVFCRVNDLQSIHIIEDGEIYTAVEQFTKSGATNAVTEYRFYKNQPYVDLKITLEFAEKNRLVRLKVPMPEGELVGDGPYLVESKNAAEVNYQRFIGVKNGEKITAVINDGVYGGKKSDGAVELTLVRAPGYLFHPIGDRELYPGDRYLPRIDCGRYVYNFRIFSGSAEEVVRAAQEFAEKPYAVNVFPIASGERKAEIVTDSPVVMPVCKTDDEKTVMRFYNPEKEEKSFKLSVQGNSADVSLPQSAVVSVVYKNGEFEICPDTMPL